MPGMVIVLFFLPVLVSGKDYHSFYTAAVFEHRPRASPFGAKLSPREIISANLQYYEKATKLAAEKGADIVVFNEYGLFPYNKNRAYLAKFMEPVPDPRRHKYNPCEEQDNTLILSSLSCMAKENKIYVVANIGEIQMCDTTCDADQIGCDQKCPQDGAFMYNTDVAFDIDGNLVAKYHKMRPYFENLNIPEETEYITFKTPFGTFGLIVCFDAVFTNSMVLAREHNVDTVLFPTFWFDDIVILNAVEWQQAWALANNVNFLAANTQTPGNGSLGSGIYSKYYGALAYSYEPDGESKLIVANVPLTENPEIDFAPSITVIKENSLYPKTEIGSAFPKYGLDSMNEPVNDHYLDYRVFKYQTENYTAVALQSAQTDTIEACHKGFCCRLTYVVDEYFKDESYYFTIYNGLNNVRGHYYWCEESCVLLRCDSRFDKPCLAQTSSSKTAFRYLQISANFTSESVYPVVTKDRYRLASTAEWKVKRKGSDATLEFKSNSTVPLLKAALLGRCYGRDPPYVPFHKF